MKNQIRKSLDEFSDESDQFEAQLEQLIAGEGDESARDELIEQIVQWLQDGAAQGRFLPLASADRRAFRSILERWNSRLRSQGHYIEGIDYLADFDPDAGIALTVECPYPGLEPYTRDQQSSFFGREDLVSQSVEHLQGQGNRILLIIGASGSGKSSIAMAGILPRLEDLHGNEWIFGPPLTPGEHPLEALAASVAQAIDDPDKAQAIKRSLADQPNEALGQMAELCQDRPLMLLIDQFEELLTLCRDESEKLTFTQVLQALSDPTISKNRFSCRILLTLRTDHLARLESDKASQLLHKRLVEVENLYPLSAIGFNDIKRAVKAPADKIGLRFIPVGLIDQLASQTAGLANGLPLLQFALRRLWETRPRNESGEPLDLINEKMMSDLPDVERALGTVAEDIFDNFSKQQKMICERLLMELLVLDENLEVPLRRRRNESELKDVLEKRFSAPGDIDKVIDDFLSAGLLRRFGEESTVQLEVAHEALLRHWSHIYRIVSGAEAKERLHLVKQIGRQASDWATHDKSSDLLSLRGKRLRRALDYAEDGWLAEEEATEYVEACHSNEEEERRREKEAENAKESMRLLRKTAFIGGISALIIILSLVIFFMNKSTVELSRIADASDQISYGYYYLTRAYALKSDELKSAELESAKEKFQDAQDLGYDELLLDVAFGLIALTPKSNTLEERDYRTAEENFEHAITSALKKEKQLDGKKDPLLYTYYYNKGKACIGLEKYEEARDAFKAAIDLRNDLPEYHYHLGISHLRLGEYKNAETALNEWRQSAGAKEPAKYYELGHVYLQQGKLENAKKQYQEAIRLEKHGHSELAKKSYNAQKGLGGAYAEKEDWANAEKVFGNLVKENSNDAEAWLYLTQAYVFLAKTAEENRQREEANEWSIKGENAARNALSISNLDEKSDLDEKDRQKAYSLIGDSLLVRGKYDQAIEAYNEARKINPKDAFLALYIADAYNESLNRSKAIEYMQIAEKLAENDPQLENEAATAHFNKNTKKIMERLGIH